MIHKVRAGAGLVDYETYRALVKDGEKADLIDGVIYMASPDKKINNDLNGFIYQLIDGFMAARNIDGVTFLSRFSCRITEFCAPEPDVGYVRPDRAHLVEQRHMLGGPDIAVEIVSRDSRARDYGVKRELYQSAGVAEYWIIDPLKGQALFPGFWLDVHWLFSSPLPKAYHCLAQILKVRPRSARKKKSR
jgi:Uma2 family endonuclease